MQPLLTTKDRVKLLLQKEGDLVHDEVLDFLIEAASEKIREFTRRRLTSPPEVQTREYPVDADLSIYIDELFAASDILSTYWSDGTPAYCRYRAERYPVHGGWLFLEDDAWSKPGLYPEDHADWFTREIRPTRERRVQGDVLVVSATFGYPEPLPTSMQYEAARAVQEWFESEVADFSSAFDAGQGRFVVPDQLPTAVQKALTENGWAAPRAVVV